MADAAGRLAALVEGALGVPLPLRVRTWDGGEAGPLEAPVLVVRNRRALRRLLWKPGELGMARGWVAGDLDIEGDLYDALDRLSGLVWERGDEPRRASARALSAVLALRDPAVRGLLRETAALVGTGLPPAPPPEEVRPVRRPAAQPAPRPAGDQPPLRRGQRLLRAGARPLDGLLVRLLGPAGRHRWRRRSPPSST